MRLRCVVAIACLASTLACATRTGSSRVVDIPVPPPARAVAELERDLAAPDAPTRAAAAWEITGAVGLGATTVQRLRELARTDADPSVRNAAAWAYGHQSHASSSATGTADDAYDQAPRLVRQPRIVYPLAAFNAKIAGTVEVDVLIDEGGTVSRAEVRRSIKGLDAAALENVRQWKFEPARKDGRPVPVLAVAPVTFRIY